MKSSPEPSIKECKTGFIHSIESFGTVDGPGIRYVVFFQGCPMRCKYCHNPDTWTTAGGNPMSTDEILEGYFHNQSFYRGGGITATGGEPLLQLPFLTELFRKAKSHGIHTCLDTSGIVYTASRQSEYEKLFEYTDLVLLDIKHSDPAGHKELTGHSPDSVIEFAGALENSRIPVIVRHVLVPGITYDTKQLFEVGRLIGRFTNLKGIQVLPYHTMGVSKYESLGLSYPLQELKDLTAQDAADARKEILRGIKYVRSGQ